MAGTCVALLQKRLNTLGANPKLTEDGLFGSASTQAVITFQKAHGLTADGIVGQQTKTALLSATPPTPAPAPGHTYPSSLNLTSAVFFATHNAASNFPPDQQPDPCAQFVSRSLVGGGLPYDHDGGWYPYPQATAVDKYIFPPLGMAPEWYNVQSLRAYLLNHSWVRQYQIYPGTNVYPVQPGDILYYEWNGQPTADHVHMALVTQISGGQIYATDQNGKYTGAVNRRWDISAAPGTSGTNLKSLYPQMKAYILHWQ